MWNEEKARRFEELRKRQLSLTDAERAELAELTKELEGAESAFTDHDTLRKLRQMSPETHVYDKPSSSDWVGPASLVCAFLVWLGTCLFIQEAFGPHPKRVTHNCAYGLFLVVCLLVALIGGAFSALNRRSPVGYVALSLGALYVLAVMSCICLLRNGWFGPAWLD